MRKELRKAICVLLFDFTFWIMPDCFFKVKFAEFLTQYLRDF